MQPLRKSFAVLLLGLPVALWLTIALAQDTGALKSKAYELYEQKRYVEAAEQFQRYLEKNPNDLQATLALVSLLSQLNRHAEAATLLEGFRRKNPQNEAASFQLGVEYVALSRYADAEKIFDALSSSANRDMATAAADALQRLKADMARAERLRAEQTIFELAKRSQHQAVIDAIAELERQGPLSFAMEMQRLYSLQALQKYAAALELAEKLAAKYPDATDEELLRADLLAQLGHGVEAMNIWRKIRQEHAGTPAATEASKRLLAAESSEAEEQIYALAREQKDREVINAIAELEKIRPLSLHMELQRLYAWQSLRQYRTALRRAEQLSANYPQSAELALLHADLLEQHGRSKEASGFLERVMRDHAGTPAAFEAEKRLRADTARRQRNREEEKIFALARQQKNREVVASIDEMEKQAPLPWIFEMQRLYALQALDENKRALEKANALAPTHPEAIDLALFRAYLLVEEKRNEEAIELLKKIQEDNPGTPAAVAAGKQLAELTIRPEQKTAQSRIYDLADQRQYREVVHAVDELERQGDLSFPVAMQRLYALQALGEYERAITEAEKLAEAYPDSVQLAVLRSDLLVHAKRWEEASKILQQLKEDHPDTPVAAEAQQHLDALPAMANLDKWYWGEAYVSGDYLGRFGTVLGSGFLRHGTFIPGLRWAQPFQEFRFGADTRSDVGGQRSVIADNFAGLYHGVRLQPFPTEYFFFYAMAGVNKDLLDERHDGDFVWDYQVGLYGFKSWGPGTVLHTSTPGTAIATAGAAPPSAAPESEAKTGEQLQRTNQFSWRLDWFTDVGADFSYYDRHASWIGYGQSHEGVRLFQIGPRAAIDTYAVQNISWDIEGNYFDNLFELGPGARLLWVPRKRWEVILRAEWLKGYYLGRNDAGTRGNADSQYDEFRVGLSVGTRW
jgi:tetratricopeptide (TPR) repeat protein